MITVVCLEYLNYLGLGRLYVETLRSMVFRHLKTPHRFVCLTDDPRRHPLVQAEHIDLIAPERPAGCWSKLQVFKPGRFSGRVLYMDVDSVVVGPLDDLVQHKGAVHLKDWGWERNVHAGGLWVWDAGEHDHVWERFTPDVPRKFPNDQEWLTTLGIFPALPDGMVASYRYHCKKNPPAGARVIAMHGRPKVHELPEDGWARRAWR